MADESEKKKNDPFTQVLERLKERSRRMKEAGIEPEPERTDYECSICQDREIVFDQEKDMAVECKCKPQKAQKRLLRASGLTDDQAKYTFLDYQIGPETKTMFQAMQQYVVDQEWNNNKGFMLSGTVGVGKTMMSQIVANAIMKSGKSLLFVSTNSLMAELRAAQFTKDGSDFESKIDMLIKADFVIFDDIGKEKPTEWVQTQYFRILDGRYNQKKPTGFTSNYSFTDLADRFSDFGEAIVSRIIAMTRDYSVNIKAKDFRLKRG